MLTGVQCFPLILCGVDHFLPLSCAAITADDSRSVISYYQALLLKPSVKKGCFDISYAEDTGVAFKAKSYMW